jgi:hypothetical protein
MGTRDVAPRLLEALHKQRFLPPQVEAPYDWPWIAPLCIAQRDPWPETDAWLAGLLDRREKLIIGLQADEETAPEQPSDKPAPLPELAATAAAMLLERHGQTPENFGLEAIGASALRNAGCTSYRFVTATARQQVIRWWTEQRSRAALREKSP